MTILQRLNEVEMPLCQAFNRINHRKLLSRTFAIVSRLGDGVFWYAIILALPFLYGQEALNASLHMVVVGLSALMIYKWLKTSTSRQRPCSYSADSIYQSVAPLDLYSFPSGHTMHATGFTIVLLTYYPEWAAIVVPFTVLVAMSRLVLGLHYPSDVAAGAVIGSGVAGLSLLII